MWLSRLLLAGFLVILSACAPGNVRLTHQQNSPNYDTRVAARAGAETALLVEIYGNPFGGDTGGFASAVTGAMEGRNWGQRLSFTTTPTPDTRTQYKVVLLFGPPIDFLAMKLCSEPAASLAAKPAIGVGIVVLGAFCRSGKSLTEIRGAIESAPGHDDPAFRELIGQVTQALFPPDPRDDNGPNCRLLFKCN